MKKMNNWKKGFKSNRRSQAEIMGITIVMVLIMLGIVFVIKFVVLPENIDIKQIYDKTQMSSNFINSLSRINSNCSGRTIGDLIQDCVENYNNPVNQIICYQDFICKDGDCSSCEYMNNSIGYMLNHSFNVMNVKYDFMICKWDDTGDIPACETIDPGRPGVINISESIISYFEHGSCLAKGARAEYESKQILIPTSQGNRYIQVYIC